MLTPFRVSILALSTISLLEFFTFPEMEPAQSLSEQSTKLSQSLSKLSLHAFSFVFSFVNKVVGKKQQ